MISHQRTYLKYSKQQATRNKQPTITFIQQNAINKQQSPKQHTTNDEHR